MRRKMSEYVVTSNMHQYMLSKHSCEITPLIMWIYSMAHTIEIYTRIEKLNSIICYALLLSNNSIIGQVK